MRETRAEACGVLLEWLCVAGGGYPGPRRIGRLIRDETEPGGTCEALSNAPEVGDHFEHIFKSGLQLGTLRIQTVGASVGADLALKSGKFLLDIWHEKKEMLRERCHI
jgi:hypothetical protein